MQILERGEARKNFSSFRHMGDTAAHDLMGVGFLQRSSFEIDGALARPQQTGERFQGGGFARAVGAEQRDQLSFFDGERDALQSMNGVVVHVDAANREHSPTTCLARNRPRSPAASSALAPDAPRRYTRRYPKPAPE